MGLAPHKLEAAKKLRQLSRLNLHVTWEDQLKGALVHEIPHLVASVSAGTYETPEILSWLILHVF